MKVRRNGKLYGTGKDARYRCIYCGRGGCRTIVLGGRAHNKCIKLFGTNEPISKSNNKI